MHDATSARLPKAIAPSPLPWLVAAVFAGAAIAIQSLGLSEMTADERSPQVRERQEATELRLLARIPTFGFDNLIADLAFLKFLQYFGDEDVRPYVGYSLSDDYFDLMTRRDPRFLKIYPYLSTAVSFYQGLPERADRYAGRGVAALSPAIEPEGYLIWRYRALDRLLLLGDIPKAIEAYERAAGWLETIGRSDSAARLRQNAQFLRENPKSIEARYRGWTEVFFSAVDDRVRERAARELLELGATPVQNADGSIGFQPPPQMESSDLQPAEGDSGN